MRLFVRTTLFAMSVSFFITLMCDVSGANIAAYVKQICERFPIHTTVSRTHGDNGFGIIIEALPGPDIYKPGETYTVSIHGSSATQNLLGVMVEVTATDKMGTVYVPGKLNTSIDGRVQDLKEDRTCEKSIISHRYLMKKNNVKFEWTAPGSGLGCVHFNATVIEHSDVWYKDEGNLHKIICEECSPTNPLVVPAAWQNGRHLFSVEDINCKRSCRLGLSQ